jgi:hypothetical protein
MRSRTPRNSMPASCIAPGGAAIQQKAISTAQQAARAIWTGADGLGIAGLTRLAAICGAVEEGWLLTSFPNDGILLVGF